MKYSTIKKAIGAAMALVLLCAALGASAQTNIMLVNNDGVNEGFNDPGAPFPGQTGNSGATLGQQRLAVFQAAADFWEARINSSETIRVGVNFDPLTCDASRAVLGSAGPNNVFRDFPGAPLANTWYVEAVANSLVDSDLGAGTDDISARFNSDIDNNNGCLNGTNWWLGINSPAVSGTISLFDTVLHEIGHGLGVLSLVSLQDNAAAGIVAGQRFDDRNDAYSYQLFDEQTGEFWRDMTNAERVASSINTGNLTWRGVNADNNSDHLNPISRTNGNIRMYAPNPVEPGSSVSHWDTILSPDELMEPSATPTSDERSTLQLLKDVGWEILDGPGEVNFANASVQVFENKGNAVLSVERTGGLFGAVSVTVNSSDITAIGGVDYDSVTNQILSWADREAGVKTISVPIVNDNLDEPDGETALLTLSSPTGGLVLGAQDSATLTVLDPDEDDFILLVVPSIVAAAATKPVIPDLAPQWAAVNEVCCSVSGLNFTATEGSNSRSSFASSCTSGAPVSSTANTTAGNRRVTFRLSSSGCGSLSASGQIPFEVNTRYFFVAQFNESTSSVEFNAFVQEVDPRTGSQSTSAPTLGDLEVDETIKFDIQVDSDVKGSTSSFRSIEN